MIKRTNCTTLYDYFLFLSSCQRTLVFLFDTAKLWYKKRCMKQRHAPLSVFLSVLSVILSVLFQGALFYRILICIYKAQDTLLCPVLCPLVDR